MSEPAPPKPARKPISRQDQRLLWLLVLAAWLALAAWAIMTFRAHISSRLHSLPEIPTGEYHRVEGFAGPLALRLDDGRIVKPAGAAVPGDAIAADRAAARLRDLAPAGADVFVELQPQLQESAGGALPASIWLPPAGTDRPLPFPYEQSRLVGAVLVQEGLVAVDPDQPYMYRNEFEMLEDDARRHGRGIWGTGAAVASHNALLFVTPQFRALQIVECGTAGLSSRGQHRGPSATAGQASRATLDRGSALN